jgi:hypothetical protein
MTAEIIQSMSAVQVGLIVGSMLVSAFVIAIIAR